MNIYASCRKVSVSCLEKHFLQRTQISEHISVTIRISAAPPSGHTNPTIPWHHLGKAVPAPATLTGTATGHGGTTVLKKL